MSEKTLWDAIRDAGKGRARFSRVENVVEDGTPDTNICHEGRDMWMELKEAKPSTRATSLMLASSHKMRTEQENWHLLQAKHKGVSLIVIRKGPIIFALSGSRAAEVNGMTCLDVENACLFYGLNAREFVDRLFFFMRSLK